MLSLCVFYDLYDLNTVSQALMNLTDAHQCDQMARLFFHRWQFTRVKICLEVKNAKVG